MVMRCDLDAKVFVVSGGVGLIWTKMPSDIVSFAVTTGFGVSVLAGIISGVCYVIAQGINKKSNQRPGREWHCKVCGTYLRSIEGVLEGDRVITCSKCQQRVCKIRCSARNETEGWVCNVCSKTPDSWLNTVLKIIQPYRFSYTTSAMDTDSLKQLEEDLEAMRNKEKAEIRDFIERLVSAMLGENVDDACVSKMYKDQRYLPVTGQSPCSAHTLLKQIIQRLLRDANDLPGLVRQEINNEVPSDDNRTYEDLLATAIINKIVTTSQTHRPSSSANSVSSRLSTSSRTRDDKEYYFGEETLDTKWKTTDLDTTSVSSIEDWMHNDSGSNKYVDRVTLTIKQNIEEVPLSDSEDEEDQDDAEYFKNKSLLSDDDANWYLQKRQFQGTHSPVPVPMLVPDPTGDAKVLIGDKELDETSDLSDVASDFGDIESAPSVNCILLKSKTVIGGKNFTDSPSMGSDGELSADSGVREEKDFDEFGSNNNIDENIHYAQAVNTASKTDITVDDDNVEDASIVSSYSNTEKDTEYTEKFASLPRTIVKNDSVTKQPEEKPSEVKEPEESETEADDNKYPEIEFEGTYSKKDKEKWKNAVQMENNPYSKENLEKRLNRSSSSVSSLFGTEYYIRQAGRATGGKAKGEVSYDSHIKKIEETSTYSSLPRSLYSPRNSSKNFVKNPLHNFPDSYSSL